MQTQYKVVIASIFNTSSVSSANAQPIRHQLVQPVFLDNYTDVTFI